MSLEAGEFKLSRVFALAIQALFRQPITAVIIAAVAIYLPHLAVAQLWPAPPDEIFSTEFVIWTFSLVPLFSVVAIFHAWIAFQVTLPKGASISPHRSVFLRGMLSIIAALTVSVVSLVGSFALLIPGLVWAVACAVVIPAVAREGLAPFNAIRRSFKLTENRRWAIFGYSLAVSIPVMLATYLLELALVGWRFDLLDRSLFLAQVVRPLTDTFDTMLGGAMSAAYFGELIRLEQRARAATSTIGGA